MNFEDFALDRRVLAGVHDAGFTSPTPIQEQAIPVALEGGDVLGMAQTGTGKTAVFMLPILQRLTTGPLGSVRALIVAPTRELAEQIRQTAVDFGKSTKIRSVAIYGGVGKGPQVDALRRGAEIVVACPGRLLDHIGDRSIDLSNVEVLVLDEADTMCDLGFLPDVRRILTYLPHRRQTMFFAATMPDEIRVLSREILNDPTTVQIGIVAPAKTVSHALYPATDGLKKRLLLEILQRTATGRVMVFTRTKHRARRLATDLENADYRVAALQGNMSQSRRLDAINGFREGKYDVLVATDLASRGIDVTEVSHVINFDMPNTVDAYIHRIGRTGRAEQTGEAFTFTMAEDADLVRKTEAVLGARIERRRLLDFDYGDFNPESEPATSRPEPRQSAQPRRHDSRTQRNGQRGQRPSARRDAGPNSQRQARNNSSGPRWQHPGGQRPAPSASPAG